MNETERENYENWLSQFPFEKNNATMEPFHCKVVGVVDENLETGINRQDIIKACKVGQSLMLLPEPTNQFNPFAVKVSRWDGHQIGYLPADETSKKIHLHMMYSHRVDCEIAEITGEKIRGVVVLLTKYFIMPPENQPFIIRLDF